MFVCSLLITLFANKIQQDVIGSERSHRIQSYLNVNEKIEILYDVNIYS